MREVLVEGECEKTPEVDRVPEPKTPMKRVTAVLDPDTCLVTWIMRRMNLYLRGF